MGGFSLENSTEFGNINENLGKIGDFFAVDEVFYAVEKDARRYKRFLGNDSEVILP